MNLDLLAISPHPDDAELYCGGLLRKMADLGHRTGIADMTAGEMGTRGTVAIRMKEAESAGRLLGLAERRNLGIPDAGVGTDDSHREILIRALRELRPRCVLLPTREARHPDHRMTSIVAQDSAFLAGLEKIRTDQEPYRPQQLIYYYTHYTYRQEPPSFIVDITEQFDQKIEAVNAYKSQFFDPDSDETATFISRPEFLDDIVTHARHYGSMIGKKYAEPFVIREQLELADPVTYFSGNSER